MTPEDFDRLQELFEELSGLDGEAREAALERLSGEHPEVLAELRSMLDVLDARTHGTRERDPRGEPPTADGGAGLGRIGPYRLVARLGEGGMGEVWEAIQESPVRRRVAVKVVRGDLDSAQVLSRFQSERQVLAMMEHPNIARVFEAGSTEDGRPYFAMELVDGEPITDYCDRRQLGVRERVELLATVCRAVQHAHRRGVIHRDLKPTNILVAEQDGEATPKIIDFGIAKATEAAEVQLGVFTRDGQLVGTPEYMSPEQVEAASADIDTRSDVYSLGVVLFELLVGDLPLRIEDLRLAAFEELRRQIRESATPRPSTRLTASDERSREVAAVRRTDAASLIRQIRQELDWVVLAAMARDREERYESASALAEDLERFVAGDAVLAGPPRLGYRARKFVRRHRVALAIAAAVVVGLVVAAVGSLLGLREARIAQARAEQESQLANGVADFLIDLFELSEPGPAGAGELSARDILDRGVRQIRERTDQSPPVRARMLETLGRIYGRLGLYDEARPLLEEGLSLRERELGVDDPAVASSLRRLGYLELDGLDRPEAAIALYERALSILEEQDGDHDGQVVELLSELAYGYQRALRYDDAREALERAETLVASTHGERSYVRAEMLNRLGVLLQETGDWRSSIEAIEEARSIVRELLGDDHQDVAVLGTNLAWSMLHVGRPRDALPLLEEEIEVSRDRLGGDHQTVADTLLLVAVAQSMLDDHDAARTSLGEARRIYALHLGPDHYAVQETLYREAEVEVFAGDTSLAEQLFLELDRALSASEHVRAPIARVRTLEWLAHLQRHDGRFEEAERSCDVALGLLEARLPEGESSDCVLQLAWIAHRRGEPEAAESLVERSIATAEAEALDHPARPMSDAAYRIAAGEPEAAMALLEERLEEGEIHAWILRNPDLAPLQGTPRFEAYRRDLRTRLDLGR